MKRKKIELDIFLSHAHNPLKQKFILFTKYNIKDTFHFLGEEYVSKYTSV